MQTARVSALSSCPQSSGFGQPIIVALQAIFAEEGVAALWGFELVSANAFSVAITLALWALRRFDPARPHPKKVTRQALVRPSSEPAFASWIESYSAPTHPTR